MKTELYLILLIEMSFNKPTKLTEVDSAGRYKIIEAKEVTTDYGVTNILTCDFRECYRGDPTQIPKLKRNILIWSNNKLNDPVKKAKKLNKGIEFAIENEYQTKYGTMSVYLKIDFTKNPIKFQESKSDLESESKAPISNFVI
jgi:hypothetical protein